MSYELNNIDAEQHLIGAMLNNVELVDSITSTVPVEAFSASNHRNIYTAVKDLSDSNLEIDLFTVEERAKQLGFDVQFSYIGEIQRNTPKTSNFSSYAKSVIEKHKEREMIVALESSIQKIKSGTGTTSERLHHSIANVNAIDPDGGTGALRSKTMREIGKKWLDDYEDKVENPDKTAGLTMGISGVDEIIGARGIQPGDMIVVAARPKSFKTATMTKIVNHVGIEVGKPTITFSMEMRDNLMFERSITQDSGVTNDNFYKVMDEADYARTFNSVSRLINTDMYIDDRSNLTLSQIKAEARALTKEHGGYGSLGAIALDYFTLMDLEGNKNNPAFGYAQLSKGIVSLGKELGCPIFLLAQLNRDCEKRPDKRPMPFDLGDTGQLERDASLILMLYNDSVYNEDSPMAGILELIVRVNRNGGTGTAYQTTAGGRLGDIDESELGRRIAESEYQDKQNNDNGGWSGK